MSSVRQRAVSREWTNRCMNPTVFRVSGIIIGKLSKGGEITRRTHAENDSIMQSSRQGCGLGTTCVEGTDSSGPPMLAWM